MKCVCLALNSQRRVSSLSKLVDSTTTTSTILQQFNQLLRTGNHLKDLVMRELKLCNHIKGERSMSNVLLKMHLRGPHKKTRPSTNPLNGAPMLKGVVLKTLIRKPKKPNSANRKCVLVRLSNSKEMVAYVPGEGHNLQVSRSISNHWKETNILNTLGTQHCHGESRTCSGSSRCQT